MRGEPKLIIHKDRTGARLSEFWYIAYFDGKRSRRVSTGYRIGTQDHEANIALARFVLERSRPTAREPDTLMVAQALRDYYEEHAQFVASHKKALSHEKRLNAHFPGYFVSQLTPSVLRKFIMDCEEAGLGAGSIRRDLAHLQAALNHEVAEQRLVHAPKIKMPPPPLPRSGTYSVAELDAILREAKKTPHLYAFLMIMMETGQRPIAIEQLTWFQVDFKEREINFYRTQRIHSKKRYRTVGMSDVLYKFLKRLHATRGDTGYVVERTILKKDGTAIIKKGGCVRKSFEKACKRAGVKKKKGQGRYTIRHTVGNLLDLNGVDDRTIQDIMGHTNVQTTRKHYLKLNLERQRQALNATAQKLHKSKRGKNATH